MGTHAKYSPSQLKRIQLCPASAKACEPMPDTTSPAAEEGTMLHEVMETILNDPESDAAKKAAVGLTKEQRSAVSDCIDYANDITDELVFTGKPVHEMLVEKKVSLAKVGMPDVSGTADVILIAGDEIHVIDWKFGRGVPVYAEGNLQLKAYGLGAVLTFAEGGIFGQFQKVVVHVAQPRLDSFTKAEYSRDDFPAIAGELSSIVSRAQEDRPEFIPGDEQCRWCKYKTHCRARLDGADSLAREAFAAYTERPSMFLAEKADLFFRCQFLKSFLKELEDELVDEMLTGVEVDGAKVVEGRKSRGWVDENKAYAYLAERHSEDELYEKKFLTAPKAEKLAKSYKKDPEFQELIEVRPGQPKLAHASDRRPEYQVQQSAADAFSAHLS